MTRVSLMRKLKIFIAPKQLFDPLPPSIVLHLVILPLPLRRSKSSAAAGLCAWVVNICKYFRIYQVVAPKRAALAEANNKLSNANKKLSTIRAKVKELQDKVAALEQGLMKATIDKNNAIAQVRRTTPPQMRRTTPPPLSQAPLLIGLRH